jgi:acetylornithine aminotransferase
MKNAERTGALLIAGLREGLAGVPGVREVRGQGLMIGVELDRPCGDLVGRALEAGLLINVTMEKVIRLLPPLVMNSEEARRVLSILVPLVRSFLARPAAVEARA